MSQSETITGKPTPGISACLLGSEARFNGGHKQSSRDGLSRNSLIAFHSRYKDLLAATNPAQSKLLGQMLGNLGEQDLNQIATRYFSDLMSALKSCATRRTHSNVLQYFSGHPDTYIAQQVYRQPHLENLSLRNAL
jgi:uncharacterized protein YbgA (DUF1722 family)